MKLWHIVLLVCAGLVFGVVEPGKLTYAFGQTTLYVLLPALLFEAAWNLRLRAIARQWRAIAVLAGPGVVLTAVLIAGALSVVRVPFAVAFLTGAILSATDPIAVVAVFRAVRVPVMLRTIVECESLFNDAMAVALYRLALGAAFFAAIGGALGGVAIGIAVALLFAWLLREGRFRQYQIPATIICAYGPYYLAEVAHCSGIFATIACGIALRYLERRFIDLTVAETVREFWDVLAIAANAVVFFLVGAALQISIILSEPAFVIATLVGVALSRVATAGLLMPSRLPRSWLDVVRVAGLRGALSLALAISLPPDVPMRSAIVAATFAVALVSLATSSITVPAAVSRVARSE